MLSILEKYEELGEMVLGQKHQNIAIMSKVIRIIYEEKDELLSDSDNGATRQRVYAKIKSAIASMTKIPDVTEDMIGSHFLNGLISDFRKIHLMSSKETPKFIYSEIMKGLDGTQGVLRKVPELGFNNDDLKTLKADIRYGLAMISMNRSKSEKWVENRNEVKVLKKDILKNMMEFFPIYAVRIHKDRSSKTVYLALDFGEHLGFHFNTNRFDIMSVGKHFKLKNIEHYNKYVELLKKTNLYHYIQY